MANLFLNIRPLFLKPVATSLMLVACMLVATSKGQMFAQQQDIVAMYLFNGQDEVTYRKMIENRSMLQVKQISSAVKLDQPAIDKLELAIKGDVARFFRRIDEIQEATKGLDIQDQNDMQKAWEMIMPIQQQATAGVLGAGSLYERVLPTVMNEEQNDAYQEYLQLRKFAQYNAILKISIAEMERSIPLLAKQREELLKLLMEQPRPVQVPEGYAPYVGFVIIARLDKEKLKPLLDPQQLAAVEELQLQFKNYDQVITW